MTKNALFVTTLLMMALALGVLQVCQFLAPFRTVIVARYGGAIAAFSGALFVNLFALIYTTGRYFLLKDTGRKLAHLERELHTGGVISAELAERIREAERGA